MNQQRIEAALAATVGAGEEPVLAADGNAAQRALGGVIGQADAQMRPSLRKRVKAAQRLSM
jgi:hypothetical protein